jgi:hypothetical protein
MGFSVTVLESAPWEMPSWQALDERTCADEGEDDLLMIRARFESDAGFDESTASFALGIAAYPPEDSPLSGHDAAGSAALDYWCLKRRFWKELPTPFLSPISLGQQLREDRVAEGWLVFPLSSEMLALDEVVFSVLPDAPTQNGLVQIRARPTE